LDGGRIFREKALNWAGGGLLIGEGWIERDELKDHEGSFGIDQ
jgi:hypothetical protein